jgi:hypothetical protein
VINSRESGFSRILKSEGGYWVPETLVEQSKTRNGHGSVTQIGWNSGSKNGHTHNHICLIHGYFLYVGMTILISISGDVFS